MVATFCATWAVTGYSRLVYLLFDLSMLYSNEPISESIISIYKSILNLQIQFYMTYSWWSFACGRDFVSTDSTFCFGFVLNFMFRPTQLYVLTLKSTTRPFRLWIFGRSLTLTFVRPASFETKIAELEQGNYHKNKPVLTQPVLHWSTLYNDLSTL